MAVLILLFERKHWPNLTPTLVSGGDMGKRRGLQEGSVKLPAAALSGTFLREFPRKKQFPLSKLRSCVSWQAPQ